MKRVSLLDVPIVEELLKNEYVRNYITEDDIKESLDPKNYMGLARTLLSAALALADHNITVNAICPGVVETEMWREIDRQRAELFNKEVGQPLKEIIENVAYLSSPESDYNTGQSINIFGVVEMNYFFWGK
ncbi:SDR family oxidoreductase [Cytobacillus purgationiresistens]|uniref:Enoyl-[acyl-carrier-protein] reductase (NADH) n=1 Tax=Cytobacillus purgationiresistens TaxID=863449 RepID=A0ABU0AM83_9BACI|nr:SDR family oxidoreductase [Cytobacillus purgationiresistens]MDQ0272371.1 enoyl-[acyl-carrier-protein] reductase (NADH) [Cytobacillus purgationiresistens]